MNRIGPNAKRVTPYEEETSGPTAGVVVVRAEDIGLERIVHPLMAPELKMLLELLFSFAQQYSAWYTRNIKNLQ